MALLLSVRLSWQTLLALALLTGCGGGGSDDDGDGVDPTPTAIVVNSGDGQSARFGMPVAVAPAVALTNARGAVANVSVTFAVTAGAGTITGATTTTNAQGVATLGGWTLGPVPGVNTIKATTGALSVLIQAKGTSGPPASITISQGNGQRWIQQSLIPVPPAVVVSDGQFPVEGAEVVFSVGSGGGTVTGAQQTTMASGVAIVGGWRLGTDSTNTLVATVANTSLSATITAIAEPLVITTITRFGDFQTGFAGNFARTASGVNVFNQFGKPTEGIPVSFRLAGGGGSITGDTTRTGVTGQARLASWRYGSDLVQSVEVVVGSEPPVTITAFLGSLVSDYRINVVYPDGTPGGAVATAFSHSVSRWQSIVVGGLSTIVLSGTNGVGPVSFVSSDTTQDPIPCIPRVTNMTIDDINIYAYIRPIDGAGGILGFASPIYLRSSNLLPFAGCMVFDEADLEGIIAEGTFESVVLHEMAHVFGFGTLWQDLRLLVGACPASVTPSFEGASARQAFWAALPSGASYANPVVPVEGEGNCDDGTRDGHWSESVFGNEVMTGYAQPGTNPLSAITSASLRDMGYVVNDAPSSAYTIPTAPTLRMGANARHLHELDVDLPFIVTDDRGFTVRIIDR